MKSETFEIISTIFANLIPSSFSFYNLLHCISNINEKQNGNTPLFLACLRRNFQIVEFLLSVGADPNIGKFYFSNPMIISYVSECKNATPLFVAILKGEVGIAEDLINHGAITSPVCTNKKVTPLHLAASKGMIESCKLLLDNGADVNALSPKFGKFFSYFFHIF